MGISSSADTVLGNCVRSRPIALAAVLLGQKLNWHHYLGGALIVSGAVILAWG